MFKFQGRFLAAEDDNWLAVVHNIRRARQTWTCMTQVLSKEGADARTSGQIYLAVVQSVLLYGSYTWVLTPRIQRMLGGFTIGWPTGWRYGNHRRGGTKSGSNPLWRMRWRRRGCMRWRLTSPVSRIQWRNILRLGPFWTCVCKRSGGQDQGCPCGGGNRRV